MVDLSLEAAHKQWSEYKDPTMYRAVCFMASLETWTSDGDPEVEVAIQMLGQAMDHAKNIDEKSSEFQTHLATLFAHIQFIRVLFILQAFENIKGGSASRILSAIDKRRNEDNKVFDMLSKRNLTFERLRLASRAFATDRLELIRDAIQSTDPHRKIISEAEVDSGSDLLQSDETVVEEEN